MKYNEGLNLKYFSSVAVKPHFCIELQIGRAKRQYLLFLTKQITIFSVCSSYTTAVQVHIHAFEKYSSLVSWQKFTHHIKRGNLIPKTDPPLQYGVNKANQAVITEI